MRNLCILIVFSCFSCSFFSQDLIVTRENDSINCKITKVKTAHIYFIFKHKEEVRSTLLPISNVKEYKYNFYEKSEISEEKLKTLQRNYKRFRVALNGGFSYQTAKISDNISGELAEYVRALKSGYHLGADFTYFVSEFLGFGLKYNNYLTSNSSTELFPIDFNGNQISNGISDAIAVSFIGPSFVTRYTSGNNKNAFYSNIALGYMTYNNQQSREINYDIAGNTLGFALDLGYDIGLSENFYLGFQLSYLTGVLREFEVSDGLNIQTINLEDHEFESLNRLDFSVGLVFSK